MKGPKMKTKRSVTKRFSLTAGGKLRHSARGRRHGLSNKSRKRKRALKRAGYLTQGCAQQVLRQMPYV